MRLRNKLIAAGAGIALCGGLVSASATAQTGTSYAPPRNEGAMPPSDAPQGSSQLQAGEERFDRVGHAGDAGEGPGLFVRSNALPEGDHAEVTALDSGRTILVPVRGAGAGLVELSGAAARQLGVATGAGVRIRRVTASPHDVALLAAGQPAAPRADAPPALLAGLRRMLLNQRDAETAAKAMPRPPVPARPRIAAKPVGLVPPGSPPVSAVRGLFVQVATLSNLQRARALAGQLGGVVRSAGSLHRVRTGPYPNAAAAERGRAAAARQGYGDARVISVP